ncbi:hypothetical protein HID58_069656 [Brassica napus]|uniref:GRF-type domain-containing protein n=1 Tax=Brassica napus TaxID=3708 RepID=A0ABQ7YWH2_BRANA|nr:hypothetical protein HID58_069656 [Brassica napus]
MSLNSRHVRKLCVSDSGDEGTGSSIRSTVLRPMSALVIGQLQEAESSSKLPPKLLAWGCYPFKLRLNIYSKDHLTIQFMPIPEAERYLWLDEATDERVTHLVELMLSVRKVDQTNDQPVHRRNLRPHLKSWIEQQFKQLASAFQKQIGELGEICAAVAVVYLKGDGDSMDVSDEVNKVHTPSYADIEIHEVNEDANAVSPQFHRTDAVEVMKPSFVSFLRKCEVGSTFKERTPIPAAPLPKHFKDDEPVNVTWGESNPHMYNSGTKDTATDPATSGANPDCEVPVTSTTDEEGEEVDPNVRNPKPLSPIIEESECGTPAVGNVQTVSPSEDQNMVETSSLEDPNPGVVVEAVEHSSGSHVLDIDGRDFPMVDDPKKTVPIPASIISSSSTEQAVKCVCNLKTHPVRAWTRKNPGRRFVSCRGRRVGSQYVKCDFFQWVDQEPPHGCEECEALKRAVLALTARILLLRNPLVGSSFGVVVVLDGFFGFHLKA